MGKICHELYTFTSNSFRVSQKRKGRWNFDRCKFPIGSKSTFDRPRRRHHFVWIGRDKSFFFRNVQKSSKSLLLLYPTWKYSRVLNRTFGKHSLRYLGPKLWNRLASKLTNIRKMNLETKTNTNS